MLTGPTGLHHEDQKLMYKDKARDSKSCLDAGKTSADRTCKETMVRVCIYVGRTWFIHMDIFGLSHYLCLLTSCYFTSSFDHVWILLVCKEGIKGNGKEAITNFQPSICGAYVSLEAMDEEYSSAHNLDLNLWNSRITDSPKANSQAQAFIWPNMYSGFNMISFFEM
ncbi:hypothetical protein L2E82_49765 [Cichorium intybus]|uniref:Uncharacterized protein n=1 Tax=Cichorium intybus TaxID=13427 RepID=A0ACB8Z213_CICIN|nr:hypothetical protein L2E82_49765 [Cichorium intybus]